MTDRLSFKDKAEWEKAEIQKWLTGNNIEWNKSMLKAELLELC